MTWWQKVVTAPTICRLTRDACHSACNDSAKRLVVPWMKRAALRHLRSVGDAAAKQYFASNLRCHPPSSASLSTCASISAAHAARRSLLLQPPVKGEPILALDPGFKHGCKLAAVSSVGRVLFTVTGGTGTGAVSVVALGSKKYS